MISAATRLKVSFFGCPRVPDRSIVFLMKVEVEDYTGLGTHPLSLLAGSAAVVVRCDLGSICVDFPCNPISALAGPRDRAG